MAYTAPACEIVKFNVEDIIATSIEKTGDTHIEDVSNG